MDETKPARKPDGKIRRMTVSNVNLFERPLQSAGTSGRLSERIRNEPLHVEQHTGLNVLQE